MKGGLGRENQVANRLASWFPHSYTAMEPLGCVLQHECSASTSMLTAPFLKGSEGGSLLRPGFLLCKGRQVRKWSDCLGGRGKVLN